MKNPSLYEAILKRNECSQPHVLVVSSFLFLLSDKMVHFCCAAVESRKYTADVVGLGADSFDSRLSGRSYMKWLCKGAVLADV